MSPEYLRELAEHAEAALAAPKAPTNLCFVYTLWDRGHHLLYVGITSNPGNRFSAHRSTKVFKRARLYGPLDRQMAVDTETYMIKAYSPRLNKTYKNSSQGELPWVWRGKRRDP